MHHSGLAGYIIDCETDDLEREGRFWSQALGCAVRPSTDPPDERYLVLETRAGQPYLELQAVTHPSRVHLDIKTDDLEAEVRRLEGLGARRLQEVRGWWVMEAPSGHRFCVVPIRPGGDLSGLSRWPD